MTGDIMSTSANQTLVEDVYSSVVWSNFGQLAWSQRITILLLLYTAIINGRMAFANWIEKPWRRLYGYKATITSILFVYYVLLVAEVINPLWFRNAVRWLIPLFVLALSLGATYHHWEADRLRYRKDLEQRLVDDLRDLDGKGCGDDRPDDR